MSDQSTKQEAESNCNCVSYQKAASVEFDEKWRMDVYEKARRAFIKSRGGGRGQMVTEADSFEYWLITTVVNEVNSKDAAVIAGLKEACNSKEGRIWQLDEAIEFKNATIKALEEMQKEKNAEIERLKSFNQKAKEQLQHEIDLGETILAKDAEIELLKERLSKVHCATSTEHDVRCEAKSEECTKLVSQVTELVTKLTEKEQENALLKEENDELKAEIERRDIDEVCG